MKRLRKPRRKITHEFVGEHKHGAACRARVTVVLDGIPCWFSCGWPRSVHPRKRGTP